MHIEEKYNDSINSYIPSNNKNTFCFCSIKVLCFLISLFTLTLGLILGAIFAATILAALPAVIVLAVILFIMIISIIIFRLCFRCHKRWK